MGYYKNEDIKDLNKQRHMIATKDFNKWAKEQLVHLLNCVRTVNFEAFYEGYQEFERIQRGD